MQKYCEFFSLAEDKESVKYILPEGMTVFSILNIPPKYNKEEVKNDIELINLQYNRLYKNGFYWILSTTDKETIICVQNSLRELIFDEVRIKFIHHNKNQILKNMKDKLDKNSYQKDTKYLGINDGYGKNKYYKEKIILLGEKEVVGINQVLIMGINIIIKKEDIINIKEIDIIREMIGKNIKIINIKIIIIKIIKKLKLIFLI